MKEMVLLGRIELPTSSLPMTRSTTELQQRSIHVHGARCATEPGLWLRAFGLSRRLAAARAICLCAFMSETQDERKARLAQALRNNLRRRKAQTREAAREDVSSPAPDPSKE